LFGHINFCAEVAQQKTGAKGRILSVFKGEFVWPKSYSYVLKWPNRKTAQKIEFQLLTKVLIRYKLPSRNWATL
jgi:hypothetical protein